MTVVEMNGVVREALHRLAPEANVDMLKPTDDLRDTLDIDSFDFLRLLNMLHDRLGVDIPESDYSRIRTLEAMSAYLAARAR